MNVSIILLCLFVLAGIVAVATILLLIIAGVAALFHHPFALSFVGNTAKLLGVAFGVMLIAVISSQFMTYTPHIDGDNAISELREITVNDSKQWLTLRGKNKDAPVILFLSGGPGGSQMGNARVALSELEDNFVMVQWDQPGSGKSRWAVPRQQITLDRYLQDGHAVTQYLKQKFGKKKIYVIGESWGSALGVLLMQRHPEDYAAFIGSGQMVDFAQTEVDDYKLALKIAKERGDTAKVKQLERRGSPPYYGDSVIFDMLAYLQYLDNEMARRGNINPSKSNIYASVLAPEYGLIDKYNWAAGLFRTLDQVFPQLYNINFRKSATKLEVPMYFLLGRHDLNAPTYLAEEYYQLLNAPKKELVWFEHSGHAPWNTEADRYVKEVKRIVDDNRNQ
ncbi:alpha/beta hydrolase [Candidatus Saccharibacteria bacterium oral taxon 955]|jgi:hypothetical protein|nr:alpha/beta hydrolase [Candidatus Saccharibacteria bacterium oral taxon 955]QHU91434.1 alpha/beta fold hydrolase [Candidatus Saccharibacteria bacterium oral taxon 955]QJU06002.1 alpha/beta hydrolase [Candidatus Saccharibacteria bacterium oral taxon 955]